MKVFISNNIVKAISYPLKYNLIQKPIYRLNCANYFSSKSTIYKSKIVLLGSGWASLYFINGINTNLYDLTVISPRNHFIFTPILPKISSGFIRSSTSAEPISPYIRKCSGGSGNFVNAYCVDVDSVSNYVVCKSIDSNDQTFRIPYDYLIIAVGAETNSFGIPGVDKYAFYLKEIEHAEIIFQKIMDNFRRASMPQVPEDEKYRLLHVVVVGGGPTGVELSGEISTLFNYHCGKSFPNLVKYAKVSIVEGGAKLLPSFSEKNSNYVSKIFKHMKINMFMKRVVCEVRPDCCIVKDTEAGTTEEIKCGVVLWASGLKETPLISLLQKKWNMKNSPRSLLVDQYLTVYGHSNIFAIGDCSKISPTRLSDNLEYVLEHIGSCSIDRLISNRKKLSKAFPQLSDSKWNYKNPKFTDFLDKIKSKHEYDSKEYFLEVLKYIDESYVSPFPTAQNAKQEAIYLAKMLNNKYYESKDFKFVAFNEKWSGSLASIGGKNVVANLPYVSLNGGIIPFLLWNMAYLYISSSWKMRVSFMLDSILGALYERQLISKHYKKPDI